MSTIILEEIGPRVTHEARAGKTWTIGRNSDADICLDTPTVGRRHAELRFTDGSWQLRDTNSPSGSYVNDETVDDAATLRVNDEIRLGNALLVVREIRQEANG